MLRKKFIEDFRVTGQIPEGRFGKDYVGHTLTLISDSRAILFGGAVGNSNEYTITNDTYTLDLFSKSFVKIQPQGECPEPRAVHAALALENSEFLIYGGIAEGGKMVKDDLFLLDTSNINEKPEWSVVPIIGIKPGRRYGHTLVFSKPYLILFGGNTTQGTVNDTWLLNIEKKVLCWSNLNLKNNPPARIYHSSSVCMAGVASGMMIIFGGRASNHSCLNDIWGLTKYRSGLWEWNKAPYKFSVNPVNRYQHTSLVIQSIVFIIGGASDTDPNSLPIEVYDVDLNEWYKYSPIPRFRHASFVSGSSIYLYGGFDHNFPLAATQGVFKIDAKKMFKHTKHLIDRLKPPPVLENIAPVPARSKKKVLPAGPGLDDKENPVENIFITNLLKPTEWIGLKNTKFGFFKDHVIRLIDKCESIIKSQPMVLKLKAPIKIFGDIHGQFSDLMRFFDLYGSPSEDKNGDIERFDYLFLGDFVDRGTHSLETICLLMAIKCKYPDQVHLIRGNHEEKSTNTSFGFLEECKLRLEENPNDPDSIFSRLNEFFEYLPLAGVISDKVICLHGGIGSTLLKISQIEELPRPLKVTQEVTNDTQQLVIDILWSDPTDDDLERGIQPNPSRDTSGTGNIVKFGPDRVEELLDANSLSMIIRAHECVMDGFERFAHGSLITVFSATDYCGQYKNAGALLLIKKNFEIVPKLIYPLDNPYGPNWAAQTPDKRPPTPPRSKNTEAGKK